MRTAGNCQIQFAASAASILVCLASFGALCRSADNVDTVTIVQTTGRTIAEASLRNWSGKSITVQADSPVEVPIDEVLSLQFPRTTFPIAAGDPMVLLTNGDRLALRSVEVDDELLTGTWRRRPNSPGVKLPLEIVAAIVFEMPASMADRQSLFADLQTLPTGKDVVLLTNGDRIQEELYRLDSSSLLLKTERGVLKLDRSRLRAVRMNPDLTTSPRISGRRLILSLVDGSHITVQNAELSGSQLKCITFSKVEFELPLTSVAGCHVYGVNAVPLSDLEPAKVSFTPFLSARWSLVKNANVFRGPLAIRGTEYANGLGMHSRMQVTYLISGSEREFRATIGIDDCAKGAGSARFTLELDGRRVWESMEMTGRSPAFAIPPLKLAGAKQLTLLVDFGKNADVSDYADWCDAVLVLGHP